MNRQLKQSLQTFAETVSLNKGRAYFVGGYVRDQLLGIESKDVDIEVHGIEPKALRTVVESHFKDVEEQGEAFGVLKVLWREDDETHEIDISLPRADSKVAPGHTGFDVRVDPAMGVEAAAQRRDFTINAIMKDILTGEVVDPFDGQIDLEARVLRAVDVELFGDDPLRVLRAVQFVARFDLSVAPETMELLRGMSHQLDELSVDRKRIEWRKLFLRASKPSRGMELAREVGMLRGDLEVLDRMTRTGQDPEWHPEGTVWDHTVWGCDEVVLLAERESLTKEDRLLLMLSNICHDMGKVDTTKKFAGHVHSKGHQEAGQTYVKPFLAAIGFERFAKPVSQMMRFHHHPMWWFENQEKIQDGHVRSLARQIKPVPMRMLSYVTEVDLRSRGPYPEDAKDLRLPIIAEWFRGEALRLGVLDKAPEDIIRGADLLRLGLKPGPVFGVIVRAANQLHDEEGLSRDAILERIAQQKNELPELDMLQLYELLKG